MRGPGLAIFVEEEIRLYDPNTVVGFIDTSNSSIVPTILCYVQHEAI